jgi:hypothetical protein
MRLFGGFRGGWRIPRGTLRRWDWLWEAFARDGLDEPVTMKRLPDDVYNDIINRCS